MVKVEIPSQTMTTRREMLDVDGTPLTSLGVTESAMPDGTGGVQKEKVYVSITTVDGAVYHSGKDVNLVVCACCRRGLAATWRHAGEAPTHGLCTEANAVRCSRPGCGSWVCPRHARDVNGLWVCRDCTAGSMWWRVLRWILLGHVEE